MTRQEAYDLLTVSEHTPSVDVQKKYQEAYNQLQLLLTNAPTPNLKKLYQRNLQELEEAYRLISMPKPGSEFQDLPSAEPVYEPTLKTVEIFPATPEVVRKPEAPPVIRQEVDKPVDMPPKRVTPRSEKAPGNRVNVFNWVLSVAVLVMLTLTFWFTTQLLSKEKASVADAGKTGNQNTSDVSQAVSKKPKRRVKPKSQYKEEEIELTVKQSTQGGTSAGRYDKVEPETDELGWRCARSNGRWGYVNESDEWVIQPKFETVSPFRNNTASVSLDGKQVTINRAGDEIRP